MIYSEEALKRLRQRWSTKEGKKTLNLIKQNRLYLSPILFKEKVKKFPGIGDKEVVNAIDLRGAPLSGFDFRIPVQEDDEGFCEDLAFLNNIHFEGATLRHCNFEEGKIHNCHFEGADLSHANFQNAKFTNCKFNSGDLSEIAVRGTKFIDCDFDNSDINDVSLSQAFTDEKTTFGKTLKSEKQFLYQTAAIQYKQIKELYKNSSLHVNADEHHYREMVCKRKSMHPGNPRRLLNYIFGDLLCKYGVSYTRVIIWCMIVIVGCALIYVQNESLDFYNQAIKTTFSDAIYFSLTTFTTLGFGDFHPLGPLRHLAGLEAFIGASLMSLFTVVVARKIIRE